MYVCTGACPEIPTVGEVEEVEEVEEAELDGGRVE
jgi:hypothetical protein